jgi:lipopolysaccharide export system ATP-binding protein
MLLRAEALVKKYKGRKVVDNISVNVEQGEIVGLLGPNGAGKTTSFYMIVGLIKPNEGRIFLDDEELTHLPMYRRAKRGIGYLAQEASIFRKLSVEENLMAVLERRRTEIARALAVDPKFVLLDEPFAGVDPIAVEEIQMIVAKLKTKNIGILITDHNVNETLSITDRAYLMFEGKLLKAGTAEELAEDEQVRRVYLGKNFQLRRKDLAGG